MSAEASFRELICRVRSGDQEAAAELVRRYEPHVRRAVRIRLRQPRLRQLVDSIDISQSVLGRFFAGASSGRFEIENSRQLIALLVKMAQNRIVDWQRKEGAQRRDKRREVSLSRMADLPASPACSASTCESAGQQHSASIDLEELLAGLTDGERRLADARLAGAGWAEIARQEGKSPDALRMQFRRAIIRVLRNRTSER